MSEDPTQTARSVRVRLFGEVDIEGELGDRTVKLKPLSRALLARLALVPGERLDTEQLAAQLVVKVAPGTAVGADMLSSAQQQLRNAQWQLRKRLGKGRGGARLLGAGRHWVALEGVRTDYRELLDAVDRGDRERARTIASRGEFLAGIDDPWTTAYRREVDQALRRLASPASDERSTRPAHAAGSARREPPPAPTAGVPPIAPPARVPLAAPVAPPVAAAPPAAPGEPGPERAGPSRPGRSWTLKLAALAALLVGVAAIAVGALSGERAAAPDASKAPADIAPNDAAVDLGSKPAGRCQRLLPDASAPTVTAIMAAGRTVAQVRTYYQPGQQRACAKLVKPQNSPLHGALTHMALTLCGDQNRCERDSHAYRTDAGPVVVASRDGCVSWRVSMGDEAGGWPVRNRVSRTGCS